MNALDILSGIGTVLDTPRRAAWALPGWLRGGTDPLTAALYPSEAVSGEDVTGDPYTGTALEMLGDPLNLIPGYAALKTMGKVKKAKAFNRTAARLLETGGMPEDVAKLTKAVTTGPDIGKPIATPRAGKEADIIAAMDPLTRQQTPEKALEIATGTAALEPRSYLAREFFDIQYPGSHGNLPHRPLRLGHGTANEFKGYDIAKAEVDPRWGKGLAWTTPDLGVASEYAGMPSLRGVNAKVPRQQIENALIDALEKTGTPPEAWKSIVWGDPVEHARQFAGRKLAEPERFFD